MMTATAPRPRYRRQPARRKDDLAGIRFEDLIQSYERVCVGGYKARAMIEDETEVYTPPFYVNPYRELSFD